MKLWKIFLSSTLCVILVGCATRAPFETFVPLPFDEAEYGALAQNGNGIIRGQVFAKTRGGDIKKGAGNSVVLFPATKYGDQRYLEGVVKGKLSSQVEDSRYLKYTRTKITDGEGRFEFTDVPPGTYYIFSNIVWEVVAPDPYIRNMTILVKQGGNVYQKLQIANGEVTEAMLTP